MRSPIIGKHRVPGQLINGERQDANEEHRVQEQEREQEQKKEGQAANLKGSVTHLKRVSDASEGVNDKHMNAARRTNAAEKKIRKHSINQSINQSMSHKYEINYCVEREQRHKHSSHAN